MVNLRKIILIFAEKKYPSKTSLAKEAQRTKQEKG
jgi:hypothetical protein